MNLKKYFFIIALLTVLFFSANNAFAQSSTQTQTIQIKQVTSTEYKSIDNINAFFSNKIDFVFSDIDGTLLPFDKKEMPESVSIGIKKLAKSNIPIVLATGRSVYDAINISKSLGLKTYIICQQGAEIVNQNGEIIYQDNIKNEDASKMIIEIRNFNKKHKTQTKTFFYVDGLAYSFENFTPPFIGDKVNQIRSLNDLKKGFSVSKIAIYNDNIEELKAIQSHMKKLYPNYHVDISSFCYCDISSLSATKGNGIKKVGEILNVNLKNTAVFGDAENDISMFKYVKTNGGLAVAVENAMPVVKQNASCTTKSVAKNGFEHAVDKILINNAKLKKTAKKVTICK